MIGLGSSIGQAHVGITSQVHFGDFGGRPEVALTIMDIKTDARRNSRAERDFQVHSVIRTQQENNGILAGAKG